ncbi:hypothetical protein IKG45_00075 [Candidatus Saccharibacteria bacterium]|nr:hypothetical protein [Candidatus Saccharibacteria bacterium]
MFPNQNSQPKPVSQFVNIDPNAGANPTSTQETNPYPNQPVSTSVLPDKRQGKLKGILIGLLAVIAIIFIILFVWKYLEWANLNSKYENTVATTVAKRELEIKDKYATELEEVEKNPPLEFAGPEDYGDLHFEYPRTWSFYIVNDASDSQSDYEAYMHPRSIGPITDATIFALKINIKKQNYEDAIVPYNNSVQSGVLTHNVIPINTNKNYADVYEGTLENGKEIKVALFKIRDKTVILRTDATRLFVNDFNKVLSSVTFKE